MSISNPISSNTFFPSASTAVKSPESASNQATWFDSLESLQQEPLSVIEQSFPVGMGIEQILQAILTPITQSVS